MAFGPATYASDGSGVELRDGCNPTIAHCEIRSNIGAGVEIWAKKDGRIFVNNYPTITNCVITENGREGISGGIPTITNCTLVANGGWGVASLEPTIMNSIIYYNGDMTTAHQIEGDAVITYTVVEGGWSGVGNIEDDPCFALIGYWDQNGTPNEPGDDVWISGDYHLCSQMGRWDAGNDVWVQDAITSPCIDAGNPGSDWADEPEPNGGCINMGAYGGTSQASMSP